MLALVLFLYSIYRFEVKDDRISFYLILQFLALNAYSMLPWDQGPIRNDDLALLMVLYSFIRKGIYQKESKTFAKMTYAYLSVVVLSAIVSFIYYQIPLVQIFKGARTSLYVLVIFDLKNLRKRDFDRLFYQIFILSSLAAFLYLFTIISGTIPESGFGGTGFLGLPRSFNFPPLIAYNCLYVVLIYEKQKKMFIPLLIISFATLLLIQSRGMLIAVLLSIAFGITLKTSKSNRLLISCFAIGVFVLFISYLIFSGDTGDKTMHDINKISSGEFVQNDFEHESDATFSYRLNLLAVSVIKTFESPIRMLFGSGLLVEMPFSFFEKWNMVDSSRFSVDGYTYFSPDISLSNIIYNIGLFGLLIYSGMIYTIWRFLMRNAKEGKNYEIVGAMFVLYLTLIAFDGSRLTWPNYLILPFFFVQYSNCIENRELRTLILAILLLNLKTKLTRKPIKVAEI